MIERAAATPAEMPIRTETSGDDIERARAVYESGYNGAGFQVERTVPAFRYRYAVTGDTDVTLRSSMYLASVTGVIEPRGEYIVSWISGGRGVMDIGRDPVVLEAGRPAMFPTGRSFAFDFADYRQNLIHLRAGYLERVASEITGTAPTPLHFDHTVVPAARDLTRWHTAMGTAAWHILGNAPVPELLRAELNHGVAVAILRTFRHRPVDLGPGSRTARAARVRLATEFAHAHAHLPITATDIAGAAGLSVRGLQQAFRTVLGTSPSEYVRTVRLDHARTALIAASPHDRTVSDVARTWGFGHMGRFSAAYRRRFGEYPRDTLIR